MELIRNIKLILEFDGTYYAGWQKQKNITTIQGTLESAIKKLTNEEVKVIGASRTDSGVHAMGFVCNYNTSSTIPADKFREALNSKLPADIVVLHSEEVSMNFHARYNSKGKKYIYSIQNTAIAPAIGRNYVYHYNKKLNVDKMIEATQYFLGNHDFSAFKSSGSSVINNVRTIYELNISHSEKLIQIEVTGDGFLYNMVRNIVGTLIDVGIERIKPCYVKTIIDSKDRNRAGKCVASSGLRLEEVYY